MCEVPESSLPDDVIFDVGPNVIGHELQRDGQVLEVDIPGDKDPGEVLLNIFYKSIAP